MKTLKSYKKNKSAHDLVKPEERTVKTSNKYLMKLTICLQKLYKHV